jgi:2-iminobutanoate/2-iminopropanoate deaminase
MKKTIVTAKAPKAIGPYSQAIIVGEFFYSSGQLGLDPLTGLLVEGGVESETRQSLMNLGYLLNEAGCSYSSVVKTLIFLKDMNDFVKVNTVYSEFFKENPPARSTVQVAGLPKGAAIEIEAIAYISAMK